MAHERLWLALIVTRIMTRYLYGRLLWVFRVFRRLRRSAPLQFFPLRSFAELLAVFRSSRLHHVLQ